MKPQARRFGNILSTPFPHPTRPWRDHMLATWGSHTTPTAVASGAGSMHSDHTPPHVEVGTNENLVQHHAVVSQFPKLDCHSGPFYSLNWTRSGCGCCPLPHFTPFHMCFVPLEPPFFCCFTQSPSFFICHSRLLQHQCCHHSFLFFKSLFASC